ncbi:MAG: murein biosynthesis integral membrane protein MurJ [Actinomycetes bacterium]
MVGQKSPKTAEAALSEEISEPLVDREAEHLEPTSSIAKRSTTMAIGTALSRGTGLLRILALGYALGFTRAADAFNLANTVPNMVFDVVLGGVIAATFLPIFVDRLATRPPREAWKAISSVISLAVIVLALSSLLLFLTAPWVITGFTALYHPDHSHSAAQLLRQRALATSLLRWFAPQVFFYGLIAIATTVLNLRRKFGAPAWTPIANNLVCIAVLLWMAALNNHPTVASLNHHADQILLLGLGTSLGVALQFLLLWPSIARSKLGRIRWRFDPRHEAVALSLKLGGWTLGFVVANQIALFVVMALAFSVGGAGPLSSYSYAWVFFQSPYAIIAVSIMAAISPELAELYAKKDLSGFSARAASGLRAVLAIVIPTTVMLFLLAKPAMALLLGHGASSPEMTSRTAAALAALALGLPGFCAFQFAIRMLQSMQRQRIAFWLYLFENILTVALAFMMVKGLEVTGLCLAISIAYSLSALLAFGYLINELGPLGQKAIWQPLGRVGIASVVMAIAVLLASSSSNALSGWSVLGRLLLAVIVGGLSYLSMVSLLATRIQKKHRRSRKR